MAAEDGVYPARCENRGDFKVMPPEKLGDLKMLMEKLQSRSSQYRNWSETIKAVRLAIANDKRCQSDALERSRLLSCVDKLQKAIKVENQQTLLEKLESIARQLCLMFYPPSHPNKPASISCEMFNLEISMDSKGIVKDVRVSHQGEPVLCEELTEVLIKEDYDEFAGHLQGFMSIYQIPGDKKQKSKAYLALQSLETDLNDLAQLQSSIKGVSNCIHKSPLGILLPRKGGFPMKLIYFVSPYDLLDKRSHSPHPMTVEAITEHELGQSVTICIQQSSSTNRLQTMPLMTVVNQDGKSLPSFQGLSNVNSCMLSAYFVLVLPQPIPVALSVVRSIQSVTNLDVIAVGNQNCLINLLLTGVYKCDTEDEFLVSLPDQKHVFYFNDVNGCSLEQPAVMVSKIPFTHPTQVAQVLNCLRQQLMFNTVIGSSIRPNASQDCSVVFELNALSLQHMSMSFEHPLHNTMVTAEIDLSDITYPKFKVIYSEEEQSLCPEDVACKIFQRCLSVPVTLRSIINKVSDEIRKEPTPEPVTVTIPSDRAPPWPPEVYTSPGKIPLDLKNFSPTSMNNTNLNRFNLQQHSPNIAYSLASLIGPAFQQPITSEGILIEPPVPEKPHNPLLADLLDRNSPSPTPEPVHNVPQPNLTETPLMSKLLGDESSLSTLASSIPNPPQQKPKQVRRKRTSKSDLPPGRSPKHARLTESESNGSLPHLDFESAVGPFDFSDISNQSQPQSVHSHGHPTLTRQLSIIDLTDPGESEMAKLESMIGNKLPRQDSELSQLLSDHGDTSPAKDTQSPHHYYHNSVPKNDNVSTSREEKILSGSREVLKTTDPTSPNYANQSLLDLLSIKSEDMDLSIPRQNSSLSLSSSGELTSRKPSLATVRSSSMSDLSDSDTFPYREKSSDSTAFNAKNSSNKHLAASSDNVKREPKEENVHDLRTLLTIGKEKSENNVIDRKIKKEDTGSKNIRLKVSTVQGLRQSSLPNELLKINKSKSSTPFEFPSDDDDDFYEFREKTTMKVISSSPTRLQISGKPKLYNHSKPKDKEKKKESKYNNVSGEKRKKDKYDKKERKKKQKMMENYKRSSLDEAAIYKSVAVVSEDSNGSNHKPIPKLKINKSSLGLVKSPSREVLATRNETVKKSKDKYDKHLSSASKKSSSQKSYKVHQRTSPSNSITVNKADSKLMTKTPTIKLKPIAMPTSSSVSIPSAKTPPAYSTASSTKGTTTPTSTTIGRIGAVSLNKSGSQTPPANMKASTPTSLSKSLPGMKSSKSTSSLPSAAKISSQRSSGSTSSRSSQSEMKESKKERNHSTSSSSKNLSNNRKSNSPMSGSRNSLSSSKSSHSSNKSLTSTSSPFASKNQSASVLSFLNTNSSVIANLPKIPKMAKTNSVSSSGSKTPTNENKTIISTAASVTKTLPSSVSSAKFSNMTSSGSNNSAKTLGQSTVTSTKSLVSSSSAKSNSYVSSPSQGKAPSTPTSTKQNPFPAVSRTNSTPSCSGGYSRSVTTVTCTISTSTKTVTTTSAVVSSKMTTSTSSAGSKTSSTPTVDKVPASTKNDSGRRLSTSSVPTAVSPSHSGSNVSSAHSACHKARPRKGSLTAVIDKLTKQTSHDTNGEEQHKSLENSKDGKCRASPDKDKSVVNCKVDKSETVNSKLEHNKNPSSGQAKDKQEENSVKVNKSRNYENSKRNTESPTKSLAGKGENKNDDSRNLFTSILKSASESPASPSEKNENDDGVSDCSNDKESCSTSEIRSSNKINESNTSNKNVNVNKHSRTPSPKQNPKKFNGETVKENCVENRLANDTEKDVFKVPTPKAQSLEDSEDTENIVVRKKQRICTSKPILSPSSPASSPELVIDCQSPRTLQNRTNSPNIEASPEKPVTAFKAKRSSPITKIKQSPLQSPAHVNTDIATTNVSLTEIDDDLMNEALMGVSS